MENLLALQPVAKELAQSKLHAHHNPADVLFIISVGHALGLNAATALMNIYNVNGMPSMKSTLKMALAKQHPEYNGSEIDSNSERCIVKMSRKGKNGIESITSTFTMKDAITAGLAKKDNWVKYPTRMLKARAVSYAVDDLFPDIVFGILSQEEAEDLAPAPKEYPQATVIDAEAEEVSQEAPQEIPVIEEITTQADTEILEIKQAINGMLFKLIEGNVDGFGDEIRRHNSFVKHLWDGDEKSPGTVKDCQDYNALLAYHDHLAAKLRGENAKPTIRQRQDALIDRLTALPIMVEELEHWSDKVHTATRHAALDEVEEWVKSVEVKQ